MDDSYSIVTVCCVSMSSTARIRAESFVKYDHGSVETQKQFLQDSTASKVNTNKYS